MINQFTLAVSTETLVQSDFVKVYADETASGAKSPAERQWALALADPQFAAAFAAGQADLRDGRIIEVRPEGL